MCIRSRLISGNIHHYQHKQCPVTIPVAQLRSKSACTAFLLLPKKLWVYSQLYKVFKRLSVRVMSADLLRVRAMELWSDRQPII